MMPTSLPVRSMSLGHRAVCNSCPLKVSIPGIIGHFLYSIQSGGHEDESMENDDGGTSCLASLNHCKANQIFMMSSETPKNELAKEVARVDKVGRGVFVFADSDKPL
jgi:hypothetical protein